MTELLDAAPPAENDIELPRVLTALPLKENVVLPDSITPHENGPV
jgi:hypothetical protein